MTSPFAVCVALQDSLLSPIDPTNSGEHIGNSEYPFKRRGSIERESRFRRAASQRFSRLLCRDHAGDDGGQHRARHQLLAALPKIPFAGARRLRGAEPLDAVFAVCRLFRRARGSIRLPQGHSSRADHVHGRLCGMGVFVFYRHDPTLARLRSAGDSRHGGRALGPGEPIADS